MRGNFFVIGLMLFTLVCIGGSSSVFATNGLAEINHYTNQSYAYDHSVYMRKQQSDADGAQYVIYQKPTANNNSKWLKYMFYQQKNPDTDKFEYRLVGIANVTLMNYNTHSVNFATTNKTSYITAGNPTNGLSDLYYEGRFSGGNSYDLQATAFYFRYSDPTFLNVVFTPNINTPLSAMDSLTAKQVANIVLSGTNNVVGTLTTVWTWDGQKFNIDEKYTWKSAFHIVCLDAGNMPVQCNSQGDYSGSIEDSLNAITYYKNDKTTVLVQNIEGGYWNSLDPVHDIWGFSQITNVLTKSLPAFYDSTSFITQINDVLEVAYDYIISVTD